MSSTEKPAPVVVTDGAYCFRVTLAEAQAWMAKLSPIVQHDARGFSDDAKIMLVEGAMIYADFLVAERRHEWTKEVLVAVATNPSPSHRVHPLGLDLTDAALCHVDMLLERLGLREHYIIDKMRQSIGAITSRCNLVESVMAAQLKHKAEAGGGEPQGSAAGGES